MEVSYKGKKVTVWQINKKDVYPEWVQALFDTNHLTWYDDRLKILVQAINPEPRRNLKLGLLANLEGHYGGGYKMGEIGNFFDATNGRVVSKKKFLSEYTFKN